MRKKFKKVMASLLALTLAITPIAIPKEVKAESNMPSAVDLSTSPYFPEIENQGRVGCCVAMSEVYYQFTYEMNKSMNVPSTRDNVFSPYAIYNMFDTYNGIEGIDDSECYEVLQTYGVPLWKDTNYDFSTDNCYADNDVWSNRTNYRVSSYSYETNASFFNCAGADAKIKEIKKLLTNGKIVSFSSYARSWNLGTITDSSNGSSNKALTGDRIVYGLDGQQGPHRVTFVGYDDNIWFDSNYNGKVDDGEMGAFKFANSWGKSWANDGYCWMTYDSIRKDFNMVDNISTINVAPYNSDSDIKLEVDVDSACLHDSFLELTAYSKYTEQKFKVDLVPFYTYSQSDLRKSKSQKFYCRGFITGESNGTLSYDLGVLIPEINHSNFNDFYYELTVVDSGNEEGYTSLNNAYIYDYNENRMVGNF